MTDTNGNGWKSKTFWTLLALFVGAMGVIFNLTLASQRDHDGRQDMRLEEHADLIRKLEDRTEKDSRNIALICQALDVKGCQP